SLELDSEWTALGREALDPGFSVCWLFPLGQMDDLAMGLIVVFCRERRNPRPDESELATTLARAASIAIVRKQAEEELAVANQRLRELSITDGLTEVKNHRHFHDCLRSHVSLAVRQRLPLSLVMLDIDFFKQFNDDYGHPAGDEVLRSVA